MTDNTSPHSWRVNSKLPESDASKRPWHINSNWPPLVFDGDYGSPIIAADGKDVLPGLRMEQASAADIVLIVEAVNAHGKRAVDHEAPDTGSNYSDVLAVMHKPLPTVEPTVDEVIAAVRRNTERRSGTYRMHGEIMADEITQLRAQLAEAEKQRDELDAVIYARTHLLPWTRQLLRASDAAIARHRSANAEQQTNNAAQTDDLCLGCPPLDYFTDKTRCEPCLRHRAATGKGDV